MPRGAEQGRCPSIPTRSEPIAGRLNTRGTSPLGGTCYNTGPGGRRQVD
jgi:hypothetical protein